MNRDPKSRSLAGLVATLASVTLVPTVLAVDPETVPVGNTGNSANAYGRGAVGYTYRIGKYEVTAGQYTAFLNAVAATDTYGLYFASMFSNSRGCKIERLGSSGSYTYTVAADRAQRPVNFVSWGSAARFANWLHNGQPTGDQDLTTTEDGSYFLDGATANPAYTAVARKGSATWVIPTVNEWHKAAYHKNDGDTGNYFLYPTSSDTAPAAVYSDPDPGNTATFNNGTPGLGAPYYLTEVGSHENSPSPYGTFDQGGNNYEWTESFWTTVPGNDSRTINGGSHNDNTDPMRASQAPGGVLPDQRTALTGFRVALLSVHCPGDFNNSGDVSVQDIFDFLAAYFSNDPSADVNNSESITVQDIFDFLAAYFTPCP
ncbi:MAG: SUMF1/EgtB/PvdO family nonheme iron enzyme [Phycisphaerales bacterium]|nr:SUMF1/EgtB/PvdO family nonheme iron enzyme [Phycisphaerales bacterium]